MKPTDWAKAAGVGALVLIVDVMFAFIVVYAWGTLFERGHDTQFYYTAAIPIARLCTRTAGTGLMFLAVAFFSYRRPERNPYLFSMAVVFFYALFDTASAGFRGAFSLSFGITIGLKLLAGLLGAYASVRVRRAQLHPP